MSAQGEPQTSIFPYNGTSIIFLGSNRPRVTVEIVEVSHWEIVSPTGAIDQPRRIQLFQLVRNSHCLKLPPTFVKRNPDHN